MSLLPVEEALRRVLAGVTEPLGEETVGLADADGRTLARDLAARRTQPPFAASSMDGYAVRSADVSRATSSLIVVGESAAGRGFAGTVGPGEAARIFTGAPMPSGADAVALQENAVRTGAEVTISGPVKPGQFVRPAGMDFREGDVLLTAGTRLDPRRLALAAAMGWADLPVRRRPRVGLLATGDELVRPGEALGPDQIVASNLYAVVRLVARAGGEAVDLGIAADTHEGLAGSLETGFASGLDVLVTLGGASVGEHDLVQEALRRQGMELGFWRIALRPGKPLMHGRLGKLLFLGLPGNPVSAIVCGLIFLEPLLRALVGDPDAGRDRTEPAILAVDLPGNDARQDYVRATLVPRPDGLPLVTPLPVQDSGMLSALARADALLVRPPHAPAAETGSLVRVLRLT
ncbi:MAG TPA: gephyrin-like molybdotransferase Glp [Beijerinckiaceae bacterium]|jgi:molybdopterin molybdotransferase